MRAELIGFTKAAIELELRIAEFLKTEYGNDAEINVLTKGKVVSQIAGGYEGVTLLDKPLSDWCRDIWNKADLIIFVGACGVAVRSIADMVKHKTEDPAVLVIDEKGIHVISLLSGHLGGANHFAEIIANEIGADPVITTSSDVNERIAIDSWAQKNDLVIDSMEAAKDVAAKIALGEKVKIAFDGKVVGNVPEEIEIVGSDEKKVDAEFDVILEHTDGYDYNKKILKLIPKTVVIGIGCKKDKPYSDISEAVKEVLQKHKIDSRSIISFASIDIKADEQGIIKTAKEYNIPFKTFSAEELMSVEGDFTSSDFVKQTTGADNICERAAVKAGIELFGDTPYKFICKKTSFDGITIAIVEFEKTIRF